MSIDSDLPARLPLGRHASSVIRERWDILAVIAVGGAIGSAARYAAGVLWPHDPSQIAWSTFAVNVVGGFLLGLLMVFVNDVWPPHRYVRPFLGVGVLGGFTTFSTYMLDTHAIFVAGRPTIALLYLLGTLVVGLVAAWLGIVAGRGAAAVLRTRGRRAGPGRTERTKGSESSESTESTTGTESTDSEASDARKGRRLP
ncbi:fluoride efflux transporter FluC [Humibacillus xanthopallidus]|uniref:fluoride efflux transporter FluC n=1 Tax=Humibacillus xanthopallidus TaxID=412689 RepID=UPI00384BF657